MKNTLNLEGKNKETLQAELQDLREKLVQLKFALADKKLKDFTQVGKIKRNIARILTALKMQ